MDSFKGKPDIGSDVKPTELENKIEWREKDEFPELDELMPDADWKDPRKEGDWVPTLEHLLSDDIVAIDSVLPDFIKREPHSRYEFPQGDTIITDDLARVEIIEFQPTLGKFGLDLDETETLLETGGESEVNEKDSPRTEKVETESDIPEPAAPNTRYELPNGDSITTDAQGRVIEKVFTPILTDEKRTPEDNAKTHAVGKEGNENDEGGHIQAHRLGGSCDRTNLFPQNSNFNRGAYKSMETKLAKALENGQDVGKVTVKLNYDNDQTARPSTVEVSYTIDGKSTVQTYKNEAGGGQNDSRTTNS